MSRKICCLLLIACFWETIVFAQSNDKFSLETSAGYHRFPGFLFDLDHSVTKHPDSLSGLYKSFDFAYVLNEKWSLGLSFVDFGVSGDGEWARTSTPEELAQGEVDGIITGQTKLNTRGLVFSVRRFFRTDDKIQPYLQAGGGIGWLDTKFNGQFTGYETESGLNFPVTEDASDRINRKVPLLNLEAGVRCKLNDHLYLLAAPHWNTGLGIRLGLGVNF